MTALTLKDIPAPLLRSLRAAAKQDRRSLTQQVIHILDRALRERVDQRAQPAPGVEAQLAAWRKLAGQWQSDLDPAAEASSIVAARTRGRKIEL